MQPRGQCDTGVDAGRNETARKRAEPGRLRGRCLAARGLAAGLLVAVAGLLALPLQAQAKILVSNVGQIPATHSSLIALDLAQAFTTGSNSAGYTLTSVEIDMLSSNENATTFTVSIHSNSSGAPGTSLGTLTNPASLAEPVVILEEGLPVGLRKPIEVGGKAERGVPFLLSPGAWLKKKAPVQG